MTPNNRDAPSGLELWASTSLDTADVYGPLTNEVLVREAIRAGERDHVATSSASCGRDGRFVGRKRGVRRYVIGPACRRVAERLRVTTSNLYYRMRGSAGADRKTPSGAMADLVAPGKVATSDSPRRPRKTIRPSACHTPDHRANNGILAVEVATGGRDFSREFVTRGS